MSQLPDCDELFSRFFAPWYREADLSALGFSATRADMMQDPDLVGEPASGVSRIVDDMQAEIVEHFSGTMLRAAIEDMGEQHGLAAPIDETWLQQLDTHFDETAIAKLVANSDETDSANLYFITCVELGTIIGSFMQTAEPALEWLAEFPYWETSLWHPPTGHIIPPVHWAIKKLSGYGWDDGLLAKVLACMENLSDAPEAP